MNPWGPYFHDIIIPQRPCILVLYHQTSSWRQNFNLCQNFENDTKSHLIGTRYVKNRAFSRTMASSNMKKAKKEVKFEARPRGEGKQSPILCKYNLCHGVHILEGQDMVPNTCQAGY